MFKKFRKSSKILSLMLALIMVFGLTGNVFAAGEDEVIVDSNIPNDFTITSADAQSSYEAVTIKHAPGSEWPDDTKYTAYLNFDNDQINLGLVDVEVEYDEDEYRLMVDNQIKTGFAINGVDFSEGYVSFKLINISNNTEYKEYKINAGIEGQHIMIDLSFNVKNAKKWSDKPEAKNHADYAKVMDALNGFNKIGDNPIIKDEIRVNKVRADIGKSAMHALIKAAEPNSLKLQLDGADEGYVREINKIGYSGLREMNINSKSGWMYKMNGDMPNVGASQYIITSSDKSMEWGFTLDWGQDLGGAPW